ncbi:MAG TPA: Xaa-Pro peptidase family protein [Alloacidobacterium sp.]|nr:Xaa-Pro peptidase family protein [Alloacidobacterium sp.]
MFSRRNFLRGSSAAALLALRSDARAQQGAFAGSVPPAIAALPDLSGQDKPFTNEERMVRIERARELMSASKIDAIILSNSATSSVYFANIRFGSSERFWALVIPAKTKPFVVCPAFEEDRARELLSAGPFGNEGDILTWQEDENPFALTVKGLKDRGVATGTVGLDENMKFIFADSLAKAGPQLHLVSAVPVTAGCRMIKTAHEVDCIRLAGRATLLVYRSVYQSLQEGMTTKDVRKLIQTAYQKVGFEGEASLNIGEFTASPHGSMQPQTIREGTILMLDDGCLVEGYTSDITRTFVLGKATDKMKAVFDIVHKAQSAAVTTAKPGVPLADVDAAARKVINDAGYGPGFKYFTHRVGHGMGMDMHEWPYFVKNNMFGWDLDPVLQQNMVLSDEPGIYIRGEFGVRLEDDLHTTEDGAELLTPQSPSLEEPFGNVS